MRQCASVWLNPNQGGLFGVYINGGWGWNLPTNFNNILMFCRNYQYISLQCNIGRLKKAFSRRAVSYFMIVWLCKAFFMDWCVTLNKIKLKSFHASLYPFVAVAGDKDSGQLRGYPFKTLTAYMQGKWIKIDKILATININT